MAKKTIADAVAGEAAVAVQEAPPKAEALAKPGDMAALFAMKEVDGKPVAVDTEGPEFTNTAYAVFASTRSTRLWPRLSVALPGLADGDPVLVLPEPAMPKRLQPFRFSVLCAKQVFCVSEQDGSVSKCAFSKAKATTDMREHVESVIVVYVDGKAVPCRITWKTTKCAAVHTAIAAGQMAADAAKWGAISEAHKQSLTAAEPWMRYAAVVKVTRRTAKGSGFGYDAATAVAAPTGPAEWQALAEMIQDKRTWEDLKAMRQAFDRRIEELGRVAV